LEYGTTGQTAGNERLLQRVPSNELEDTESGKNRNDNTADDTEGADTESHRMMQHAMKLTKLVVPFFLLIFLFAIVALILGLLDNTAEGFLKWGLSLGTLCGGLFGAWGVYKWGTIEEEIDRLKGENNKYEGEILLLKSTKEKLATEVTEMQSAVTQIKSSVDDLNNQLGAFDELRQELQKVAGANEDIATLLDNTTQIFRDMRAVALANEKASLLNLYYEVAFKDGEAGMSTREYERFKGGLPKRQRSQFEAMGTFKDLAGDNDTIDLWEFQEILEKFLTGLERELVQSGFESV